MLAEELAEETSDKEEDSMTTKKVASEEVIQEVDMVDLKMEICN